MHIVGSKDPMGVRSKNLETWMVAEEKLVTGQMASVRVSWFEGGWKIEHARDGEAFWAPRDMSWCGNPPAPPTSGPAFRGDVAGDGDKAKAARLQKRARADKVRQVKQAASRQKKTGPKGEEKARIEQLQHETVLCPPGAPKNKVVCTHIKGKGVVVAPKKFVKNKKSTKELAAAARNEEAYADFECQDCGGVISITVGEVAHQTAKFGGFNSPTRCAECRAKFSAKKAEIALALSKQSHAERTKHAEASYATSHAQANPTPAEAYTKREGPRDRTFAGKPKRSPATRSGLPSVTALDEVEVSLPPPDDPGIAWGATSVAQEEGPTEGTPTTQEENGTPPPQPEWSPDCGPLFGPKPAPTPKPDPVPEYLVKVAGMVVVHKEDGVMATYQWDKETGVFRAYDSVVQDWGHEILSQHYTIVEEGVVRMVEPTPWYNHYKGSTKTTAVERILTSSYKVIPNFVIQARTHGWFGWLRRGLVEVGYNVSFGYFFDRNILYRGMTKRRRTIVIHKEILSFITSMKLCMTVGIMQNRHLATPILEKFKNVPYEVVIDTMIYFTERRTHMQARLKATTEACEEYLKSNRMERAPWIAPEASTMITDILRMGAPAGNYSFTSREEATENLLVGRTCVQRESYVASDASHGSASNPTVEAGGKFELVTASEGSGFEDPYVTMPEGARDPIKDQYQSVGGCFATRMKVVRSSREEFEKCGLRMFAARKDEQWLREQQRQAYAYTLALHYQRDPFSFDKLTAEIKRFDEDYVPPKIDMKLLEWGAPVSNLQRIMHILQTAREEAFEDEFDDKEAGTWFDRMVEYIRSMGVKMDQRYAALKTLEDEINVERRHQRVNKAAQKPHEPQKFKKGVLKYARLFISVTDEEWAKADPLMMQFMKRVEEQLFTVTNNVLWVGSRCYDIPFPIRDCWYRTVLKETEPQALAGVVRVMEEWLQAHPGGIAGISHGDDQAFGERFAGEATVWTESDITLNDGSHTSSAFRMGHYECVAHGYEATTAFAQLGKPIEFRNQDHRSDKVVVRSVDGEYLPTGHIGTTYFNSKQSGALFFATAVYDMSDGPKFVEAAETLGFLVEVPVVRQPITSITFLSKAFFVDYVTDDEGGTVGDIKAYTEIASLFRNYGRITGDIPGSSKAHIVDRWLEHVKGVAKGWVNEPTSLLLDEVRRLSGLDVFTQGFVLGPVDEAYLARYYPDDPELGYTEYLDLVGQLRTLKDMYGFFVVHPFIDRIMKKRYGMEPIST